MNIIIVYKQTCLQIYCKIKQMGNLRKKFPVLTKIICLIVQFDLNLFIN